MMEIGNSEELADKFAKMKIHQGAKTLNVQKELWKAGFCMKLGLDTVEFAAQSGKRSLQAPIEEIRNILSTAGQAGIQLLDTASDASDSETALGECLAAGHSFRLVSRTHVLQSDFMMSHQADQLEYSLRHSLDLLGQNALYGLMLPFREGLLAGQGERLFRRMETLRSQGMIEKVGLSVSTGENIDWILSRFKPDIIQLPLNVLDQRLLASGHLSRLKKRGVEVHVRDVFLQGILLDPLHLHPWFGPLQKRMEQYHDFLIHEGLTPLEGALNFVTSLPEVDYALVGAQSASQLGELIGAMTSGVAPDDFAPFAAAGVRFTDPLQWNLYE